jgi:uncharacterized membrane-anchored protein YitT (DUF2179 family)
MKTHWKKQLGGLAAIFLGNAIYALAVAAFILPNGLITGGSTGLALVVRHIWGVPVETFVAVFNPLMFFVGLWALGWRFAATTLVSSFWYPVVLGVFQQIPGIAFPTEDKLLAVAFAGGMIGVAIGIVIRAGASTGGMDIPPLVLHSKAGVPVSVGMYAFDFLILVGQMLFAQREQVLYGILLVVTYTVVLDKVLVMGSARTQVKVVSPRHQEIREKILREMDRGCTLVQAETGLYGNQWPMVVTVITGRELPHLTRLVQETDPDAFLVVNRVSEVRGRGFTLGKVYRRREEKEEI